MRSETAIGPAPGPPPPCGCVNVLCRLKWTMSKPMSPGRVRAHHRVEVGAVVVERRADVVDDVRDLLDVLVEQSERVRVGEHQAGDVVARLGLEVLEVDAAARVGADLHDLVAGHRHRRRVGAVRGVGRQHLGARLAAVLVVGARQQHAGELAVRAGARLQRDVRQPGDLGERALQLPHQPQRALRAPRVLERVQARVAGQRGDPLVQLRVVLHRARAERVEAGVEVEVALREAVVVADDLRLGDLRAAAPARCGGSGRAAGRRGAARRARARRTRGGPGWDFSKIVRARSRCCGSSGSAVIAGTASADAARLVRRPLPARAQPVDVGLVRCSVIATSSPFSNSG